MKGLFFFVMLVFFGSAEEKRYVKNYFPNGNMKSEGWMQSEKKVDYWFYYYENGSKKEEGHYVDDEKQKWWLYYNLNGQLIKKVEYKNNKLHGFAILYKNETIYKAEKYNMGIKTNEWTSLADYQKDNQ